MSSSPSIACRLATPDRAHRLEALRAGLFARAIVIEDRDNGYRLAFSSTDANASALAAFIKFERLRCPLLTFAPTIPPEPEPIALTLTGDSSVTAFVRDTFIALVPMGSFTS